MPGTGIAERAQVGQVREGGETPESGVGLERLGGHLRKRRLAEAMVGVTSTSTTSNIADLGTECREPIPGPLCIDRRPPRRRLDDGPHDRIESDTAVRHSRRQELADGRKPFGHPGSAVQQRPDLQQCPEIFMHDIITDF